jgi:hypothetical protein
MKEAAMVAETTAAKQWGRPFPKGQSGNPRRRPVGARNTTTVMAEQLLDGESEVLIRKVIERAKEGDMGALRLCLDRASRHCACAQCLAVCRRLAAWSRLMVGRRQCCAPTIRSLRHPNRQLATSPAFLRVMAICSRAARAINPLSFAIVTNRNPIAIMRAA